METQLWRKILAPYRLAVDRTGCEIYAHQAAISG